MSRFDTTPDDRLLSIAELKSIMRKESGTNTGLRARLLLELDSLSRRMAAARVLPEELLAPEMLEKVSADINSVQDVLLSMKREEQARARGNYWQRLWRAILGR